MSEYNTPSTRLLRVDEVRERLGVGHTTVYQLLKTRQLERVKIGSSTRVPEASLERFVAALTENAA